jgi:uncharacterized Zn finger protein
MAEPPSQVYVVCPAEDEETLHSVLDGEVGERGDYTLDAVVECRECGATHQVTVREPADEALRVVVSEGSESRTGEVELPRDGSVSVGEKLVVGGRPVVVTDVERDDGDRVDEADVALVETIWAKDHSTVTLKFSVHEEGLETRAFEMETHPRDEVVVGDEVDMAGRRLRIHTVKTEEDLLEERGQAADAEDVVRVYAQEPEDGS